MSRCRAAAIVLALFALPLAFPVRAQTPSPFAYWQNSAGVVLRPLAGPPPEWQTDLGLGVAVVPRYEGSDGYRPWPAVSLDVRYEDIAFLSTGDGLGVNLLRGENYRAGLAIAYDTGREHRLATRLSGTGNVEPTPEIKGFAEAFFLPVIIQSDIRRAVGAESGLAGDLGLYMPLAGTETFDIFAGPEVTFADDTYMSEYFGIDPNHAEPHSIFPLYRASGGIKNANFGVSVDYRFTDSPWSLHGDIGFERLLGSAATSPIVQERWQGGSSLMLLYSF